MADVKQWITINGVHVPIMDGSSKEEAIHNFLNKATKRGPVQNKEKANTRAEEVKRDEQTKEKQISENKKQAENIQQNQKSTQALHQEKIKELESDKYEGDNTYDLETLKPISFADGYQVTFCQIGDNYTPEQYQQKVNECLKLSSDGKTYAGKFEGTPEISFHCASRNQAIAYARANNQISIWDWKRGNKDWRFGEIKTGGTGRRA